MREVSLEELRCVEKVACVILGRLNRSGRLAANRRFVLFAWHLAVHGLARLVPRPRIIRARSAQPQALGCRQGCTPDVPRRTRRRSAECGNPAPAVKPSNGLEPLTPPYHGGSEVVTAYTAGQPRARFAW